MHLAHAHQHCHKHPEKAERDTHVLTVVVVLQVHTEVLHREHALAGVVRERAQQPHQLPNCDVVERHDESVVLSARGRVTHDLLEELRAPRGVSRDELLHGDVVSGGILRHCHLQGIDPAPRSLGHRLPELGIDLVHGQVAECLLLQLRCNVDRGQLYVLF